MLGPDPPDVAGVRNVGGYGAPLVGAAAVLPVAVGLDHRDGEVAVHGWTVGSGVQLDEALGWFSAAAAFVLAVVHPTYAPFTLVVLTGFAVARLLVARSEAQVVKVTADCRVDLNPRERGVAAEQAHGGDFCHRVSGRHEADAHAVVVGDLADREHAPPVVPQGGGARLGEGATERGGTAEPAQAGLREGHLDLRA